jgi:hypothetical protein
LCQLLLPLASLTSVLLLLLVPLLPQALQEACKCYSAPAAACSCTTDTCLAAAAAAAAAARRRSKKLTEYEKWEYKQLKMAGVLDVREYPLFDEEGGQGLLAGVDEVSG